MCAQVADFAAFIKEHASTPFTVDLPEPEPVRHFVWIDNYGVWIRHAYNERHDGTRRNYFQIIRTMR
jgi:hypothetical protein